MTLDRIVTKLEVMVLAVGFLLVFTTSMFSQVQSSTSTTEGTATREVKVQRAEVVYVSGNDLVVKMDDGEIRHIANVPESAKVDVDGRMLGIHELKPGMKLQRTVTTTTTPKMITKVETVKGTVVHVMPPTSVTLRMENNETQRFKIPDGQKFNVEGQMVDAFGLKEGMIVTASKVTETPETHVTHEQMLTGKLPPPPPPPPEVPILIVAVPAPAPAPAETAQATPEALPKTGTHLPAIGLLGVLMLSMGLGLRAVRGCR